MDSAGSRDAREHYTAFVRDPSSRARLACVSSDGNKHSTATDEHPNANECAAHGLSMRISTAVSGGRHFGAATRDAK